MTKKFSELKNRMPPAARRAADNLKQQMLKDMPLQELRQARALSQEQIARILEIKQASVSKLEHRTDMYIQTLRSYIKAMGGELEITARFPEGIVHINQFSDQDDEERKKQEYF